MLFFPIVLRLKFCSSFDFFASTGAGAYSETPTKCEHIYVRMTTSILDALSAGNMTARKRHFKFFRSLCSRGRRHFAEVFQRSSMAFHTKRKINRKINYVRPIKKKRKNILFRFFVSMFDFPPCIRLAWGASPRAGSFIIRKK